MRISPIGFLATLAFAALPVAATADSNTGLVRGTVTLPDGTPACGVHVRVLSQSESPWTTQTDSNGEYVFLAVLPGPITIQFAGIRQHRHWNDADYDDGSTERFVHVSANLPTYADATVAEPPAYTGSLFSGAPERWRAMQHGIQDIRDRCAPGDARYALFSNDQTF